MNLSTGVSRFAFVVLLAAASSLCTAQTYNVTNLGAFVSGGGSAAQAINSSGVIAGDAGAAGDVLDVFTYSDGILTNLGTLGGTEGIGNAINALGQVAGYSTDSAPGYHAFLSIDGVLTNIGDLGGGQAVAYGVNDSGQVVGSSVTAAGENLPFLYSNGTMTNLGSLGGPNVGWSGAFGINNEGEVVGESWTAQGVLRGFTWINGIMTEMGTLGGDWSQAYAVNNKGQVTGIAYLASGAAHAFIASPNGKLKDLGTLYSPGNDKWGLAINDAGVVVGRLDIPGTYHAFIYRNGKMQDLNDLIPPKSGWVLLWANGINNAGQIVGIGTFKGQQVGFLLTPR